ncbi:MAG: phosphoribosylformylglycinamidine cyclo-ligase [Candidatus Omnitrophica bacterium]|nr:phosphoribosylformylglycinamidine cyclo-ligase [Candidatus Omnitrophota bacterium]
MSRVTYKKSGVDIKKADQFVKGMKNIFSQTKLNKAAAFGSLFNFKPLLKGCKEPILVSSTDGVGTKLLIAQQSNIHSGVGIDLVAMNVNDIICLGAKPLFFLDYIACGKLNSKTLLKVAAGINQGLRQSDCLLLGGETAEMPGMYKGEEYDLAGFCVGVVDKKRIISGDKIKPGNLVIGLESSGLHSNGFSLVRKVLGSVGVKKYAKQLLKPTRIYVKEILSLISSGNRASAIKGIAHITGGAFYSKATKVLPKGLGMVISKRSWKVPSIFKIIKEKGEISDKEMYTVFNMGIGMILVVDKKSVKNILTVLNKSCKTHLIGEIVKSSRRMNLV